MLINDWARGFWKDVLVGFLNLLINKSNTLALFSNFFILLLDTDSNSDSLWLDLSCWDVGSESKIELETLLILLYISIDSVFCWDGAGLVNNNGVGNL